MEYTNQLIAKAKGSICKLCQEEITEQEAEAREFQSTKTNRGVSIRTHPVLGEEGK